MNDFKMPTSPHVHTHETENPFPGLRPFKMEESYLFFGREGQSDEVLYKLTKNRFVSIIGPSGSGKSSFVYCGMLPLLHGGFITDISSEWEVIVAHPGMTPIDNLAESLVKTSKEYVGNNEEDKKTKKTIVSTILRSSSLGLVESILQLRKDKKTNYLILVDQFEELFWVNKSVNSNFENETLTYINLLLEAINYEDAPIYVALTMRSDFIGNCAQFPALTQKLNDSHYLIPQMTREQKRKAIEGPLAVNGTKISPRLVQQLLNDLGDNSDQLPILQHAMMRTWTYWHKYEIDKNELLDTTHYEAIGTLKQALSMHANEAFEGLSQQQQHLCETIFKVITEKRGESGIRRPTSIEKIAAIANSSEKEIIEIVDKFREPSRSLITPNYEISISSESIIDISHESLMRIWTRLKSWVDDEAEAVQMYLRLTDAASMYQAGKAGLWRPPDLQLALNWKTKYNPKLLWARRYHPAYERTMAFLEYAKNEFETEQRIKKLEQKRKLKRAKVTAIVFGSMMVVALLFLVYAIYQQTEAIKQESVAKAQEILAKENAKEASKQRDAANLAKKDAEKQRDAANQARDDAERQKQRAERNFQEAERQREKAQQQQRLANENALKAKKNEKIANTQRLLAVQKEQEARRSRYIAQAKAMALKSQELSKNPERAALLAQQAYNFNSKYEGYQYDNDIYNSLFRALRNYDHELTKSFESHEKGAVRALAIDVKKNLFFSGGSDGKIIQWHKENNQWIGNPIAKERDDYLIYSMDISQDGNYLVAGGLYSLSSSHNYMELYNLETPTEKPLQIAGHKFDIGDIHFSPDGTKIYSRDNSGNSIKCYYLNKPTNNNVVASKEIVATQVKINSLAVSPSGKKLAGAGEDGNIYLWNVHDNFSQRTIKISDSPLSTITFDPNDSTEEKLVIGDLAGLIKIIENDRIVRELFGHEKKIEHIQFSHQGHLIASSSKDFKVRLWNYDNLKEPPITLSNQDWVWGVSFSADDKQLIAGLNATKKTIENTDYPIHIWPTHMTSMNDILCNLVKRNMTVDEWDIYVGEDLKYEKTCLVTDE